MTTPKQILINQKEELKKDLLEYIECGTWWDYCYEESTDNLKKKIEELL